MSVEMREGGERSSSFFFTIYKDRVVGSRRSKVHLLNEGYMWVSKTRDFA